MKNAEKSSGWWRGAVLAAVALLALSGCTSPAGAGGATRSQLRVPFSAEITARLDAVLAEAITLSGSSGALAGVWAPWAGEWVASPGSTAPTGGRPLSPSMSYRIGTNTTTLTCTVLAKLADEGTVSLDDLASTHLNRMVGLEGITLSQLCRNTSGLADYARTLGPQFVANPTRIWPPREVIASGMGSPRASLPGGGWTQSDTGLVLLGMALEAASNQSLAELYGKYILDPADLTGTSLPDATTLSIPGTHPRGYSAALDSAARPVCGTVLDVTALSPSMGWAAGGAVSTLADQRRWATAFASGSLLSVEGAKAAWTTVSEGAGAPEWRRYGLGGEQLGPLRGRAGAIPGFASAAYADPESGLTVVVAVNNSTNGAAFAEAVARRLAAIVWAEPSPVAATADAPRSTAEGTAEGSAEGTAPSSTDAPKVSDPPSPALPWTEEQAAESMRAAVACVPVAPAPAG